MEETQTIAVPKKSKVKSFFYAIWKFIKFVVGGFFKIIFKIIYWIFAIIFFSYRLGEETHYTFNLNDKDYL